VGEKVLRITMRGTLRPFPQTSSRHCGYVSTGAIFKYIVSFIWFICVTGVKLYSNNTPSLFGRIDIM
jgi:hypothetical protein